ncbi:hypothetical protein LEP1GSC038_4788 [Leptospira weilii str. 2006001855]|uniref:Uncharacterized protein n=1 Tax=Leptospira weilii str. 2006001855 TaxID=996804 RepID=M6FNA5_9LEPT|nr:hypothetical protein LEP1GSC038_4788 [Leptospira weilii str. 2006001855]
MRFFSPKKTEDKHDLYKKSSKGDSPRFCLIRGFYLSPLLRVPKNRNQSFRQKNVKN